MKTIAFTAAARRSFRKLPDPVRAQIEARLARYAKTGEGDIKKLTARSGVRLRVGSYRVIFVETADLIDVREVGDRRDIYD